MMDQSQLFEGKDGSSADILQHVPGGGSIWKVYTWQIIWKSSWTYSLIFPKFFLEGKLYLTIESSLSEGNQKEIPHPLQYYYWLLSGLYGLGWKVYGVWSGIWVNAYFLPNNIVLALGSVQHPPPLLLWPCCNCHTSPLMSPEKLYVSETNLWDKHKTNVMCSI